jgi:hypothetical protein
MASNGVEACNKTIYRLIQRLANRVFSDGNLSPTDDQSSVSFPATSSSLSEYFKLERFADREEYHARLQSFVRTDAVRADWDRRSSEQGQLARLTLNDPTKAAELLGIDLPWVVAATAIQHIEQVAGDSELTIAPIVDAWKHGRAPGGVTANKASQFIDSIRVIEAARRLGASDQDLLLRRVSTQLFGDSKRIESLARPIAYLLGDDSDDENVFSHLGLVKHPQPMLLSGGADCRVHVGEGSIPLLKPYIGLRPDRIEGLSVDSGRIQHLLTIENLASFNEAAEYSDNPDDLLIVYVAGNPTPSWLAAYRRLLKSGRPTKVMHWGDIDVGGFRIAGKIAESAIEVGYSLDLWQMNAAEFTSNEQKNVPGKEQVTQIVQLCEKYGWHQELAGLKDAPVFLEQEFNEWIPPST